MPKKKKIDKKSTKYLRKKLWEIFSKYVRIKEKGKCISCPTVKHWKEMNAGHFVHKDCLDFDERNVHCQCPRCNLFLSGNSIPYAIKLESIYGYGIVQILKKEGDKIKIWKTKELEDKIAYYKQKVAKLEE